MYEIMQISQVHRTVYDFRPLLVKHSHRYARTALITTATGQCPVKSNL